MDAHRTMVGAADTAKERSIARRNGVVDIEVLLRSLANNLNEVTLTLLSSWLHRVLSQG